MTRLLNNIAATIPKVDRLLEQPAVMELIAAYGRPEVLAAVQMTLDALRQQIRQGGVLTIPPLDSIINQLHHQLSQHNRPSLKKVINGTGIVVHTNLGRSPLADAALDAIRNAAAGYSNLEYVCEQGVRGTRFSHVEQLICELTGAEAALVVNNNAAAVLLALSSLACGREVIVSRGELVEIGGSFRIPDVMRQSGAQLVEVGSTNRTYLRDYQQAVTAETGLLLKVHTSNFSIVGFTCETSVAELAQLGREKALATMLDAGSGCLIDLAPYGIGGEATIRQQLAEGIDMVTFSGDKLLGGPQAGIIAGKRHYLEAMKHHPLLRALRIDKLTLAGLEATLRLYRDPQQALTTIPTLQMLTMSIKQIRKRTTTIIRRLRSGLPAEIELFTHSGESNAGGGAFPLLQLPTILIEVRCAPFSPTQLDAALRSATIPVIGRINRERYLLDVRTIRDGDLPELKNSLHQLVNKPSHRQFS